VGGTVTADAALLTNIQRLGGTFAAAMGNLHGVAITKGAWQALAGEITKIMINPVTGLPDPAKAGELSAVFSGIDQHCDNQLYGDKTTAAPIHPLAQYLLG
jgi:hypothetical protein